MTRSQGRSPGPRFLFLAVKERDTFDLPRGWHTDVVDHAGQFLCPHGVPKRCLQDDQHVFRRTGIESALPVKPSFLYECEDIFLHPLFRDFGQFKLPELGQEVVDEDVRVGGERRFFHHWTFLFDPLFDPFFACHYLFSFLCVCRKLFAAKVAKNAKALWSFPLRLIRFACLFSYHIFL